MNLTKRKNKSKSGTGERKGKRNKENHESDSIDGHAQKPRIKPRPKPSTRASKALEDASNVDQETEHAALALVSLNQPKAVAQTESDAAPSLPEDQAKFEREWERLGGWSMIQVPATSSSSFGDHEEAESDESDEEEVDELEGDESQSDDEDLEVPVESPSHRRRALKSSRHAFDIPVEVPYRNATRDVTGITSASSFDYVLSEIRERMDATPSQLAGLAYIPSYKPRNPKPVPKLLEDEQAWEKLVQDVRQYIETFTTKKGVSKPVKPFVITIVDTVGPRTEKEKEKKAGSSKKSDSASDRAAALTHGESRQLEELRRLEARHFCQEHKKPCFIQLNGSHYQYSIADLTKWSLLMVQGKALLDEPPAELNLTDSYRRQHTAKKAMNQTVAEQSSQPSMMEFLQGVAGMFMMQNMANRSQTAGIAAPSTPVKVPQTPSGGHKRPSTPVKVPLLIDWSADLTVDPARQEGKLADYLEILEENEIRDLNDFVGFSEAELIQLTGMKIGLAKRLLRYANADLDGLRQAKQRRID
ncbi:hypothetical protein CVT26_008290 [Gymnopilus dilepis]|uniref:SAM domain-containing protein n=1 Tax=Gymnopilus dilepis TaxID=231916 RepID=A0A409X2K0_9AGAR|nr:hypothetical protein CVT26_008290 [Gymnopilus dilepis]